MSIQKQDLMIPGPVGDLETVAHIPDQPISTIGIMCHPNPLQEGTMDNKVVTTVVRAFNALGMVGVRFNYRSVGRSAGEYGAVDGEVADCLAVIKWAQQQWPGTRLWLAGFSFGAYIAAAAAAQTECAQLISIAPAVERMPYSSLPPIKCPWLVIQGTDDDVVTPAAVYAWYDALQADKTLINFPATGHFFHGKLVELQQAVQGLKRS